MSGLTIYQVYQLGNNDFQENWSVGCFSSLQKAMDKMISLSSFDGPYTPDTCFLVREMMIDDMSVSINSDFEDDNYKHNTRLYLIYKNEQQKCYKIETSESFNDEFVDVTDQLNNYYE